MNVQTVFAPRRDACPGLPPRWRVDLRVSGLPYVVGALFLAALAWLLAKAAR